MLLALLALALICLVLALPVIAPPLAGLRRRLRRGPGAAPSAIRHDPGRDRRAEQRARALLRSCVNEEEWAMYRDLGFIRVRGGPSQRGGALTPSGYAYLVYAHKPIVAYLPAEGRLLSEYCVEFPDVSGTGSTRLPPSDDVLAKWMALTSDEARVIGRANMHLIGRQHDPARLRRDLWRLLEWESRRSGSTSTQARGS